MIKNERQYRITKIQAEKFARVLEEMEAYTGSVHPKLRAAQAEAIRSQYQELREAMQEYETLQARKRKVLDVDALEDLPRALIRARIASGLTQKELAERLGMKEQQIQRYEATEYASASLSRLLSIVRALGVEVRGEVRLPG